MGAAILKIRLKDEIITNAVQSDKKLKNLLNYCIIKIKITIWTKGPCLVN